MMLTSYSQMRHSSEGPALLLSPYKPNYLVMFCSGYQLL